MTLAWDRLKIIEKRLPFGATRIYKPQNGLPMKMCWSPSTVFLQIPRSQIVGEISALIALLARRHPIFQSYSGIINGFVVHYIHVR